MRTTPPNRDTRLAAEEEVRVLMLLCHDFFFATSLGRNPNDRRWCEVYARLCT